MYADIIIFVDCCDGSDEYDSSIKCPNTCVMGGNIEYKAQSYISTINDAGSIDARGAKIPVNKEDLIERLRGILFVHNCYAPVKLKSLRDLSFSLVFADVKMVVVLQLFVIIFLVVLWITHHRVRSKRRHSRWRNPLPAVHYLGFW